MFDGCEVRGGISGPRRFRFDGDRLSDRRAHASEASVSFRRTMSAAGAGTRGRSLTNRRVRALGRVEADRSALPRDLGDLGDPEWPRRCDGVVPLRGSKSSILEAHSSSVYGFPNGAEHPSQILQSHRPQARKSRARQQNPGRPGKIESPRSCKSNGRRMIDCEPLRV